MSLRVAVIEDDEDIATLIKQVLVMDGHSVSVVNDGKKALEVLETGGFDVAVLDVMLPGKDGVSIMKEIRERPTTHHLPVVMLTAKAESGATWAGWQAGCDLYLTKPFDPQKLIHTLKSVVGARR